MLVQNNEFNNSAIGAFFDNHASYDLRLNEFNSDFGAISAGNGNDANEVSRNEFYSNACDSTWILTHTEELLNEPFKVHPNPTTDKVFIRPSDLKASYILYNSEGQTISTGPYPSDGVPLPYAGVFLLSIQTEDNYRILKRVVRI